MIDGRLGALDDLTKKQWALHASIVASKINRGEKDGADLAERLPGRCAMRGRR